MKNQLTVFEQMRAQALRGMGYSNAGITRAILNRRQRDLHNDIYAQVEELTT